MSDFKDNVKVAIRIRPLNDQEFHENAGTCLSVSESKRIMIDSKPEPRSFTYDNVADENMSQEEVFEIVGKPITTSCLKGYNGTIFAYGQTGAGKTFTIQGTGYEEYALASKVNYHLRGILPRCFEFLFSSISEEVIKNQAQYLVKCSYLEIYQEQINDLLDQNPRNLQLREDMKKGVYVDGLIEETVENVMETYELLNIGAQNRHVSYTNMNKESSRSHSVFTLIIESKSTDEGLVNFKSSRFHLIDLAGSERQKATDCAGDRLKEAGMINKSLSALGNVINSLVDISEGKSRHVHYRDSKLTFLLKDSLGGNSKTFIIANVSPSVSAFAETMSTLKFAQRAKMIKNSAVINEDVSGTVNLLKIEIKKLKDELNLQKNSETNCPKCNSVMTSGIYDFIDNTKELELLLEQNTRLRINSEKQLEQDISDKEKQLKSLKLALSKVESKANHDKMILKFRDATILKLQSGFDTDDSENLRKENTSLREQIENNPLAAQLFVENEKLKAECEQLKKECKYHPESLAGRIKNGQDYTEKLCDALSSSAKEKGRIMEIIDSQTKENQNLKLEIENNKKEFEACKVELQQKVQIVENEKEGLISRIRELININKKKSAAEDDEDLLKSAETIEEFFKNNENFWNSKAIEKLEHEILELKASNATLSTINTSQLEQAKEKEKNLLEKLDLLYEEREKSEDLLSENSLLKEKIENLTIANQNFLESIKNSETLIESMEKLKNEKITIENSSKALMADHQEMLTKNNLLKSEIEKIKQETNNIKAEYEKINSDYIRANESIEKGLKDFNIEKLNYEHKTETFKSQMLCLEELNQKLVEKAKVLEKNNEKLTLEIENLRKERGNNVCELEKQDKSNKDLLLKISQLTTSLENNTKEKNLLNKKVNSLSEEISQLIKEKSILSENYKTLQENNANLISTYEEKTVGLDRLNEDHGKTFEKLLSVKKKHKTQKDFVQSVLIDKDLLNTNFQEAKQDLNTKIDKISELETEILLLNNQIKRLEEELLESKNFVTKFQEKHQKLIAEFEESKKVLNENQGVIDNIKRMKMQFQSSENKSNDHTNQFSSDINIENYFQELIETGKKLNAGLSEKEKKIGFLHEKEKKDEIMMTSLRNENKEKSDELDKLKESNLNLLKNIKELEGYTKDFDLKLLNIKSQKKKKIHLLKENIKALENSILDFQSEKNELQNLIITNSDLVRSLHQKILVEESKSKEIAEKRNEMAVLMNEKAKIIASLESKINEEIEKNEEISVNKSALETNISQNEEYIKDLQNSLESERNSNEENILKRLESEKKIEEYSLYVEELNNRLKSEFDKNNELLSIVSDQNFQLTKEKNFRDKVMNKIQKIFEFVNKAEHQKIGENLNDFDLIEAFCDKLVEILEKNENSVEENYKSQKLMFEEDIQRIKDELTNKEETIKKLGSLFNLKADNPTQIFQKLSLKLEENEANQSKIVSLLESIQQEKKRSEILAKESEVLKIKANKLKSESLKEINSLKDEISSLENKIKFSNEINNKLSILEASTQDLNQKVEEYKAINQSLLKENSKLLSSIAELNENKTKMNNEMVSAREEIESLKEENKNKMEILKNTNKNILSTRTEIHMWKKSIDDKNQFIQDLREDLRKKDEEIFKLQNELKNKSKVRKESPEIEENSEIKYLAQIIQIKEKELKDLKEKGQEFYSQADQALESQRKEIEIFTKRCASLQGEVKRLKEELRLAMKDREAMIDEIKKLKSDEYRNFRENEDIKRMLGQLREEKMKNSAELSKENDHPSKNKYERLRQENALLNSQIDKLRQELEILNSKNEALLIKLKDASNSNLTKELDRQSEEISNLTEGLSKISDLVFNLPQVSIHPDETSLIESTLKAIRSLSEQLNQKDLQPSKIIKNSELTNNSGFKSQLAQYYALVNRNSKSPTSQRNRSAFK